MSDKMHAQEYYEQWLSQRREVQSPTNLVDQVMSQITEMEDRSKAVWWLRLVQRIESSRAARWSMCGVALAIGSLPFFFFARAASF